jgi:hypothetical protein
LRDSMLHCTRIVAVRGILLLVFPRFLLRMDSCGKIRTTRIINANAVRYRGQAKK